MLSINKIKYLKSLHQRKFRQKYQQFIAEGTKLAEEILNNRAGNLTGIYALPEWLEENRSLLSGYESIITEVTPSGLKKISTLQTPNQVLMVLDQTESDWTPESIKDTVSIYLEEIRDPGNLGTILRIADWFGISWVLCSENCVDTSNPKVVQSSMGAFLRVKSKTISIDQVVEALPELPVYGTVLGGRSIFEENLPSAALVVIGNESSGISAEMESHLTHRLAIPRHPGGGAESLNAAVATGIVCAMFRHQPRRGDPHRLSPKSG